MNIDNQQRLNAIKARLGSLSPRAQAELYGSLRRLVLEDIPWLLAQAELSWPLAPKPGTWNEAPLDAPDIMEDFRT